MDETDKREQDSDPRSDGLRAEGRAKRKDKGKGKGKGKAQEKRSETKLRLFIGLAAPIDYGLRPLRERLQGVAADSEEDLKLRFVRKSDLHITLKFLGSLDGSRLEAVERIAAERLAGLGPLELHARRVGLFRNALWAGIEQQPGLDELARTLNGAFEAEGVAADGREFMPHVTVARFRAGGRDRVAAAVREFEDQDFGRFYTERAFLYRSETLPEGARYTIIRRFHLGAV